MSRAEAHYDDALAVGQARDLYFQSSGFDPNYDERWVKLKAGPITLMFPNAAGRRRAVKLHDLHHVATGYQTTWVGEGEIAGWEIGGGCGAFTWAWGLNLSALAIGFALAPRAVFDAFVRGRHSTNLYRTETEPTADLLASTVGDMRRKLGLDRATPDARLGDVVAFAGWTALSLAPIAAVIGLIAWL